MGIEDAKRLFLCISDHRIGGEAKKTSTLHPSDETLREVLQELQYFPLAIDTRKCTHELD